MIPLLFFLFFYFNFFVEKILFEKRKILYDYDIILFVVRLQ